MKLSKKLAHPLFFGPVFLGFQPHDRQLEVLADDHPVKILAVGRRGGKSELVAAEIIRGCVTGEYPFQACIAPRYKQSNIIFKKCRELLRRSPEIMDEVERVQKQPYFAIFFRGGAAVEFLSADNPDSLRGEGYDRIFIDEAGDIPPDAMDAIRPMLFDSSTGSFWMTGTPKGMNHFYDMFRKGLTENPRVKSFRWTSFENPYINRELVMEEIEEYGDKSIYIRTEIYAEFLEDQGRVFAHGHVMRMFDPSLVFKSYEEGHSYIIAADLGKYRDYTVVMVLDVTQKPYALVHFQRFNLQSVPADRDSFYLDYVPSLLERLSIEYRTSMVGIDATGIGDAVLEVMRQRLPAVKGFIFTNPSKMNALLRLEGLVQKGDIRIPETPGTEVIRKELLYFEYEKTPSGKYRAEAGNGMHDDCVAALIIFAELQRDLEYSASFTTVDFDTEPEGDDPLIDEWDLRDEMLKYL